MPRPSRVLEIFGLCLILLVAAYFRWTGLAWDSGYLFHPDERQILLIVSSLEFPSNPLELFSPSSSLNPKFFAYGSFPIYLLWALIPIAPPTQIVGPWADDQLARWVLFGRALSGLFDLGTLVLTYALGRRIYDARVGLIAAACAAVTVLHIQLSHFYAVDTLLTFLTMATLYCAFRVAQENIPNQNSKKQFSPKIVFWNFDFKIFTGICFGLALATKITAFSLLVPILYACYHATNAPIMKFSRARLVEIWRVVQPPLLQITGVAFVVFVVTQPYAVIDWYTFGRDVVREAFVARGWLDYPYTRQYMGTLPFAFQVTQGTIWGMGLPLGIFAWGGGVLFVAQWWKTRNWRDAFVLSFALFYFITISLQYTKYLRYVLPLLPVLYIMAACAFARIFAKRRVVFAILASLILAFSFFYSLAFIQIYAHEHPWLTASRWLYENVPAGRTLLVEQWDDALPTLIRFSNRERRASDYIQIQLPMYDDDTAAKRAQLAETLARADVVILASQRVYGSIGKLPTRYPMTNRYYKKLFSGELGFEPAMTTRNDPNLFGMTIRDDPFAGLTFDLSHSSGQAVSRVNVPLRENEQSVWNWGFADESFSVYDHPQPIVFQKVRVRSVAEIEQELRE